MFSLDNLVASALLCRRGVSWKREVQAFCLNLVHNCQLLQDQLHTGEYRMAPGKRFVVKERGKLRNIVACSFRDRVVQRTLCDRALVPAVRRVLVYDNGACIPDKGTSFALRRLDHHLRQHYVRLGLQGGIVLFDVSKYFESIDRERSMEQFSRLIFDERLLGLLRMTLGAAPRGLGLGNQTSQVAAVLYLNEIDQWVKNELRLRGYGRYMDDGYALFSERADMRPFADELASRCASLGLELNPRKLQLLPARCEFTFLKTRFRLREDGQVEKRLPSDTFRRRRRHVVGLHRLQAAGILDESDLAASEAAFRGVVLRVM